MSEKTEDPTPQRLRKAREEGQVAHSKDMTQTVLVIALFGYMFWNADGILRTCTAMILLPANVMNMEFNAGVNLMLEQLFRMGAELLFPFLAIVILLGIVAEGIQTGWNVAFKAIQPSGKKLDIVQNAKNMFGAKGFFEFLKSNIKIALLSVVLWMLLRDSLPALIALPYGGIEAVASGTGVLLRVMMLWVCIGYLIISAADLVWQNRQHIRELRMTKDEVKRDYKEAEGDPHIKHKRKELHRELLQHAETTAVKHASAVVTNPTHVAVALRYELGETPLPIVLAKGEGHHAERIRAAARLWDIPVVQDVPLARALLAQAELNQYIPSDLIEPVALLLRAVRELKEKEQPT